MASQSYWEALYQNLSKHLTKGVKCPECEKQWLGHHFNGARWCADCGYSFYGSHEGETAGERS